MADESEEFFVHFSSAKSSSFLHRKATVFCGSYLETVGGGGTLKLCFFDANFVVCLLDSFMFLKIENVSNFLIKNALTMNHSQSPVFLRKKPLLQWRHKGVG